MRRALVIDGNHVTYRAYYKFKNLKTIGGINTSIVFGIPRILESLVRKFDYPDKVIVVFDGKKSKYRLGILPEYKQRDQKLGFDREDFIRQRQEAMDALGFLAVPVVYHKNYEADDLIALLTRRLPKYHITIVSGDKDFNQLISETIDVYNVNKGKLLTLDNAYKELGYRADQTVDFLSLWGDSSDNISGYPGIGEVRAKKFLEQFGSIKEFLKGDEKFGKTDKILLKEIAFRNKKLIDLKYYYRKNLLKSKIPYYSNNKDIDLSAFKRFCAINETNSFLKPQFINTFKKLING